MWNKPHTFRPRAGNTIAMFPDPNAGLSDDGGTIGFVYTRHGGFIDLGHARDFIDHTNFFAAMYRDVASGPGGEGSVFLWNAGADMHLLAEQTPSPPDFAICALLGAKLAFEYSIWHEIESYFSLEKYSSFAPEDVFSNAVGVVAGFRAMFNPSGTFDRAADQALKEVLELLGPVTMETTEKAMQYVKDHWWKETGATGESKRRNFLSPGAIRPWLVTDLVIPGREAGAEELRKIIGKPQGASITIPTRHKGVFLERRARLAFRNLPNGLKNLTGLDEITSINLRAVSTMLRDLALSEEGASIATP